MRRDATTPGAAISRVTDFDVLLPSQWCEPASGLNEPDRRLRLAVLENAIGYFQRYVHPTDRRGRMLHEDALDWLSDSDRSDFFSFENVCDALGLDADSLRRGLLAWRDAELRRAGTTTREQSSGTADRSSDRPTPLRGSTLATMRKRRLVRPRERLNPSGPSASGAGRVAARTPLPQLQQRVQLDVVRRGVGPDA